MDNDYAISVREAAQKLGISASKMYELARSDGFPSFTIGKRLLIWRKGLEQWVENQASMGCHS